MIYRRGKTWWYEFTYAGERIRRSTRTGNKKAAREIESAARVALARGEAKIETPRRVPTVSEFAPEFIRHIEIDRAEKPATILFYKSKLKRLLEYRPLAAARLDAIDDRLLESYVAARMTAGLAPATMNRELATLRRMLHLARRRNLIPGVPRIVMRDGERSRDFVLSRDVERHYLEFAPEPLRDAATLILDTGMRIGEIVSLLWSDVHLEPVGEAKFGYVRVRSGKTRHARRTIPLTGRVSAMLESRLRIGERVFCCSADSLQRKHQKLRDRLGLGPDFVIHSLRHTFLTRLGEAGVDAFTIKRIAGHGSITVSENYVHPTPEGVERAFERLEVPTKSPTLEMAGDRENAVSLVQ